MLVWHCRRVLDAIYPAGVQTERLLDDTTTGFDAVFRFSICTFAPYGRNPEAEPRHGSGAGLV